MIPLKDEIPSHSFPLVNVLLISANVAVFIIQNVYIPGQAERLYYQFGFIPYKFFHFACYNHNELHIFPSIKFIIANFGIHIYP